MTRKTAILAGIFCVAAVLASGYWIVTKKQTAAQNQARMQDATQNVAPSVTVVRVKPADFIETAVVSGSLIPREEILVSPEIEGLRVVELFVDEGDTVKKGQVMARLVSEQLDAQLAQNEANLARAEAAIAQARSQIAQADAVAKEARAQLKRAEPLKKSGYLSGSTYDQRESAARTAEAQLVAARDGLTAAAAEKTQIEAQRRELTWRRSNTSVTAPEDGVISRRNARIGALASGVADPMFRIIAKGEIELDAEVVETELQNVKPGQKAFVTVPGAADVEGNVRLVSPEVDKTTRLGRVKIFLGKNPALRIGSYARGRIETAKSRGLAVPNSAVTFDQEAPYAYAVNGETVEMRYLKTGLVAGGLVEILSGLKDGDLVIARAGTFLRDGDVVRPILPAPAVSEAK
jgi:RND family efflux transporter MFP subunit